MIFRYVNNPQLQSHCSIAHFFVQFLFEVAYFFALLLSLQKRLIMKNLQGYFDTLLEDGYIVKDDIERGYLNVIPLWMFGLNY